MVGQAEAEQSKQRDHGARGDLRFGGSDQSQSQGKDGGGEGVVQRVDFGNDRLRPEDRGEAEQQG